VHVLKKEKKLSVVVECEIDKERRKQLAQHHTSAHIVNAAARRILGNHVNQASAYKDISKARLDITHYKALSEKEISDIEKEANKIVSSGLPVRSYFVDRGEAEKKFGMGIYQGGVVPGRKLRIVEIPGVDVEACGGTHLGNTKEAGMIKILKSSKVSDSIVRIEYVSGKAAGKEVGREEKIMKEVAGILKVGRKSVAIRAAEVFRLWKDVVKKKKDVVVKFVDVGEEDLSDKEILEKTAHILKTQIEHIPKTLKRFLKELKIK